MLLAAAAADLEQVAKVASGVSLGAVVVALGRWVLGWRRESRLRVGAVTEAEDVERRLALTERQQSLTEVWSIVEDLREANRHRREEIQRLNDRLDGLQTENSRLARMVVTLGGDPYGRA